MGEEGSLHLGLHLLLRIFTEAHIITYILWMKKSKLRKIKWLAQSHMVGREVDTSWPVKCVFTRRYSISRPKHAHASLKNTSAHYQHEASTPLGYLITRRSMQVGKESLLWLCFVTGIIRTEKNDLKCGIGLVQCLEPFRSHSFILILLLDVPAKSSQTILIEDYLHKGSSLQGQWLSVFRDSFQVCSRGCRKQWNYTGHNFWTWNSDSSVVSTL